MDKNKIACLSQKQIKAIKKDCVEKGIDIARMSESNLEIMVVDELIKQSSYQEFKNELLPHLMG